MDPSPVWNAHRVWLKPGRPDWYEARSRAFTHAREQGYTHVGIVCSTVQLFRRAHGNEPMLQAPNDQHGMWLYLNRLVKRYGHVYVPPLRWARQMESYGEVLAPTIPLVAAYQMAGVDAVHDGVGSLLGTNLCAKGYDSFTVGDYFHFDLAKIELDEYGSAATWRRAYERAITTAI